MNKVYSAGVATTLVVLATIHYSNQATANKLVCHIPTTKAGVSITLSSNGVAKGFQTFGTLNPHYVKLTQVSGLLYRTPGKARFEFNAGLRSAKITQKSGGLIHLSCP